MKNNKFCNCFYHYVCYGGIICMNKGCGKPHSAFMGKKGWQLFNTLSKKEQRKYLDHPEKYYIISESPDGTNSPLWAKKDGSIQNEIDYQNRHDEELERALRPWWKFWI